MQATPGKEGPVGNGYEAKVGGLGSARKGANGGEHSVEFDPTGVVQIRSDTSSSGLNGQNLKAMRLKKQKRKEEKGRRLRKLRDEALIEGFNSCAESQDILI